MRRKKLKELGRLNDLGVDRYASRRSRASVRDHLRSRTYRTYRRRDPALLSTLGTWHVARRPFSCILEPMLAISRLL